MNDAEKIVEHLGDAYDLMRKNKKKWTRMYLDSLSSPNANDFAAIFYQDALRIQRNKMKKFAARLLTKE